jgi:hypothetical protein
MRKSIISSLIATVVANANDRMVAAGVVAGARLRRNSMREHLGNWHEPMFALLEPCYQPAYTRGGTAGHCHQLQAYVSHGLQVGSTRLPNVLGNIFNVVSQLWQRSSKRSMQHAYAFSPAYAAIARDARKS